jgi:hypothetical protein
LGYSRRDSASEMFVSNGIDKFEVRMLKATHIFKQRLFLSTNTTVYCLNKNGSIFHNYVIDIGIFPLCTFLNRSYAI